MNSELADLLALTDSMRRIIDKANFYHQQTVAERNAALAKLKRHEDGLTRRSELERDLRNSRELCASLQKEMRKIREERDELEVIVNDACKALGRPR